MPRDMALGESVRCDVLVARLRGTADTHASLLDDTERQRAQQFLNSADRERFTLATAVLKTAVAIELDVDPRAVVIDRACPTCGRPHGRPRLAVADLQASISHSGDMVLVAVAHGARVGVDVEAITSIDVSPLVDQVCTPAEADHVRSNRDFFCYWTRKESVLKATGEGLRTALHDVVVSPPTKPAALWMLDGSSDVAAAMNDLAVDPGHSAALTVLTAAAVDVTLRDAHTMLAAAHSS